MSIWGGGDAMVMLICAALLAPIGIAFLVTARRRRMGVRPYCAACDYALHGLPAGTNNCPECGADISAEGAVAAGRRRRDVPLMLAGLALLAPALVATVLDSTRSMRAARTAARPPTNLRSAPFLPYATPARPYPRPTPPPVSPYASLTDAALVAAILAESPATPKLDALLAEASTRAKASASATQSYRPDPWVTQLVDAGLAIQADAIKPWPLAWARFIESLQNTRHLPHEDWRKYLNRGVQIEASFRDAIEFGNPFPLTYRTRVASAPSSPHA